MIYVEKGNEGYRIKDEELKAYEALGFKAPQEAEVPPQEAEVPPQEVEDPPQEEKAEPKK